MGMQFDCARAIGAISTWGLKYLFHRPAANFPGKVALYIDPQLISDLKPRITEGSIIVVGTNGKTTVTNLLADALEAAGKTVVCNRTGANLDSGVATALLHTDPVQWGVFESDELWLAKTLPHLQANVVLLLNLFRDQLDRVGEIDHIQESIVQALSSSPDSVLVYNADDPFCQAIANRAPNASIAFGIGEDLKLPQNTVADARMCQNCSSMLEYEYRQYGQLGAYRCPTCGFSRAPLDYAAVHVNVNEDGLSFSIANTHACGEETTLTAPFSGVYMVYNLMAVFVAAQQAGIDAAAVQQAIDAFDPKNGRLQPYTIDGTSVLLNLAKNPTGFNQNLKIVLQGEGPKAVGFFINDKEADGHDVSWLWDIDFQELADQRDMRVFAGGIRKNDMQVRLKYAGVDAGLVDGAADLLAHARAYDPKARVYLIANYTALPTVKAELDHMEQTQEVPAPIAETAAVDRPVERAEMRVESSSAEKLTILHMFPALLNLYGDNGNVIVLADRIRRRGIDVDVVAVESAEDADFEKADIVFMGGGPDREQHLASVSLMAMKDELQNYVEDDGVLLAICGGYQIIGHEWLMGDETVPGLDIVDISTKRAEGNSYNRLVGNIALKSPLADLPVVGYENHAGRTYLGTGLKPFGNVVGTHGKGNNDTDKADGVLYRNVVGSYLHGPLLAKNPEVADALIERALIRRAKKNGSPVFNLVKLDDTAEIAANACMSSRLGVRK